jgi:hypothetical protein
MSNDTSLLSGSTFEFSLDDGTTYTELEGIQEFPEFKDESEEIENTTVKDTTKQFRPGMDSPTEQTLTAFYLRADTVQLAFRTAARNKSTIKVRVTYSDGDSLALDAALKNYGVSGGDAPTQKMWTCVLRRTTPVAFTEATS